MLRTTTVGYPPHDGAQSYHTRPSVAASIVAARREINANNPKTQVVSLGAVESLGPAVTASPAAASLALILDVDDTLLKEVSLSARDHASVQMIRYVPAARVAARYRQQLEAEQALPAHKVIHYEFEGESMRSAIVLRPGIERLIDRLRDAGCVLLLASVNDGARTAAVCSQVRLSSGLTLAEVGFRVVPRDAVSPTEGAKDIASIRAWARLDDLCLAVVVDDRPHDLANTSISDHVVPAPPFDQAAADTLLALPAGTDTGGVDAETLERDACSAAHTLPHLGVSMKFLEAFLATCMGEQLDPATATTNDVCEAIVKERWLQSDPSFARLSFANLVQDGRVAGLDRSMVGPATHFTSHAWSYRFVDLVDALQTDVGETSAGATCFFWLDIFVVPQRVPVAPPQAWWATSFFRAIAAQRTFVLVVHSWDAPRCVTRCWCLWEIYAAIRMGKSVREGTLQIATSREQRRAFSAQLLRDAHGVQKAVLRVDAARAQAWNPTDRAMIFGAIERHVFEGVPGFDGIDAIIKRLLQNWIAQTGRAICAEAAPASAADRALHASLRHAVGLIAHQHADYAGAEQQFRLALAAKEDCLGVADDSTLETIHRLALTLRKTPSAQHEAEAGALLRRIGDADGASAERRLRARKVLGEMLIMQGGVESVLAGVEELRFCLEQLQGAFEGEKRAGALAAKDGGLRQLLHCEKLLATGLRAQGKRMLDEALALHRTVAREWAQLDGESHDNALTAQHELALTLEAAGSGAEAVELLERLVALRVREDGAGHRKTAAAICDLAAVRERTSTGS